MDQTCCGQPAMNAGYWDEARRMAKHTIEVFEQCPDPIVIPSGSCAGMIRQGYLELFRNDPEWLARADAIAKRTFEFSEFLVDELAYHPNPNQHQCKFVYHPSCHLTRGLGVDRQPKELFLASASVPAQILETECCGFGGVFAIDQPELSSEMLKRTIKRLVDPSADVVVGCDVSCLMHIEGGLRKCGSEIRCAHLAQLLAGQKMGLR